MTRGGGGAALISMATDAAWLRLPPNPAVAAIKMQSAMRRSDIGNLLRKSRATRRASDGVCATTTSGARRLTGLERHDGAAYPAC
jgi:hypothetical protein